jgi:hypothetical protein
MSAPKLPEILEKIADKVLAYHPKPKTKPAEKRKKRATKLAKLENSKMLDGKAKKL